MITIYKNKNDFHSGTEYIEMNDIYFNKNTCTNLDIEVAKPLIEQIDGAKMIGKYMITSKFNGDALNIDKLSTGCKTMLNLVTYPDKVFCIKECGDNALKVIYKLDKGNVYSDYPVIPFDLDYSFTVMTSDGRKISDYEELKEWWNYEG